MMFNGKTCVISGGTSGIGLAVAERMVREGARVVILGRDGDKGRRVVEHLGPAAAFVACDVGDLASVEAAFDEIERRFEHFELAVNNAGVTAPYGPVAQISAASWEHVLRVNVSGPLYCMRRELQCIGRSPGGAIVNVSSCAGVVPIPNQAAYVASKAALNALTQVAAMESACDDGADSYAVRVNAVAPGPTYGGMNSPERLAANPERTRLKAASTAMKRFAEPEEIAGSVVYLLGGESSYVTGTILNVDGGYQAGKC
ncbi:MULTISPECIES: SDR family NAD(P)-dependent oxidoreductase [Burkholderia cepacia complex]|uniref:SDR family NAD(P)-dependent oxidoreductase n=1 Tax=Burkholderia cepacia complex TaxID=87882 RepID=UPI00064C0191|nr:MULTISPECIES: SDR family oxidoreductase [Burkholderia cepacia complex]AKM04214.1 hypothetical protein ABD05_29730 [Burkholderia pyrrocinia]